MYARLSLINAIGATLTKTRVQLAAHAVSRYRGALQLTVSTECDTDGEVRQDCHRESKQSSSVMGNVQHLRPDEWPNSPWTLNLVES